MVWMLDGYLFGTCSAQSHNTSTMVVCRIFATNDTAYAVCSTDTFNASSACRPHENDPSSTSSGNVTCDKLELLSHTSCLSESSADVIETVISTIPSSVSSLEMFILQSGDDVSYCQLELPQHFGNLSSLVIVSLVLDGSHVNFYFAVYIYQNTFLSATINFYNSLLLRRMMYLKWARYSISPVHRTGCKYNEYYDVDESRFMFPIKIEDIYLLCDIFTLLNCTDCSCCMGLTLGITVILATSVISVTLLIVIVTVVIGLCRKNQQLRIANESPRCLEAWRQELMVIYAYGDKLFDRQSFDMPFMTAADVSYHTVVQIGSWHEILDNFNTKPQMVCVILISPDYLQKMTKSLAENGCDDETRDLVTSFHLSQRTFPVLIGDINLEDFPAALRGVYFKLNLRRWPNYPTDRTGIRNTLQQIHKR